MRSTHFFAAVILTAGISFAVSLRAAQAPSATSEDYMIGTWQLDISKSKYSPGPGPVSETRTYRRGPNGIEGTIQRRFSDGRSERIEYVAEFDREYPVVGTEEYDHILLKRISPRVAEAMLSHAGRTYGSARRVVDESGKTMTITFKREGSSAPTVNNTAFYEKVDEQP
jgi:hypothetical protein